MSQLFYHEIIFVCVGLSEMLEVFLYLIAKKETRHHIQLDSKFSLARERQSHY